MGCVANFASQNFTTAPNHAPLGPSCQVDTPSTCVLRSQPTLMPGKDGLRSRTRSPLRKKKPGSMADPASDGTPAVQRSTSAGSIVTTPRSSSRAARDPDVPLTTAAVELSPVDTSGDSAGPATGAGVGAGAGAAPPQAADAAAEGRRAAVAGKFGSTRYSHYSQYAEVKPRPKSLAEALRGPLRQLSKKVGRSRVAAALTQLCTCARC